MKICKLHIVWATTAQAVFGVYMPSLRKGHHPRVLQNTTNSTETKPLSEPSLESRCYDQTTRESCQGVSGEIACTWCNLSQPILDVSAVCELLDSAQDMVENNVATSCEPMAR